MTRRDYTLKWLFYSLTTLFFVVLQSWVLPHVTVWGIHPFLLPVIVALATMWEGNEGLLFSLFFGLLTDLTTTGPIPCFYTLAFFVAAAAAMLIAKRVLVPGFFCAVIVSVLAIILCDLLQILFLSYSTGLAIFPALLLLAKELLLSVVCMPLIFFPFRRLHTRSQMD